MDSTEPQQRPEAGPGNVRTMSRWARVYAQNRTVPVMIALFAFLLFFVAIGGLSYLARLSAAAGRPWVTALCFAALACVMMGLFWWVRRGGRVVEALSARVYAKEGNAVPAAESESRTAWPDRAVGFAFGGAIVASVVLGLSGHLPERYMQPVSAIYSVPFLLYLIARQWGRVGPIALLWPLLYAGHAALIVAGVPLPFLDAAPGLHILFAVVVYGGVCTLVGHLYSRIALSKLKRLGRSTATPTHGSHGQ